MNFIAKINNLSDQKKTAIVFIIATIVSSGLNMLTTPLFTRIMPIYDFGVISLYNTWYSLLFVIGSFSVTNAVVNVGFHNYPTDRNGYIAASLGLCTLFTVCLSIIFLFFSNSIIKFTGINYSLFLLMFLSFIFTTATQLWINLERYEYRYKKVFIITILTAIFSTILSVICVLSATDNYAGIKLWSTNIVPLLIGLYYFYYIMRNGALYNKEYWKFVIVFNSPLILHYLSQFILNGSDRIMINYFCNESSVALYSLSYTISNILLVIFTPINSVLIPYFHKLVDSKSTKQIEKCMNRVLLISAFILLSVSLFSPELILILGGEKYKTGIYVIPPITSSTLFIILYLLTSNIEFLYGKTHRIAIMTIVAAILNIVLNWLLIPRFGYIAAAYTTLAAFAIYSFLHLNNMYSLYGKMNNKFTIFVIITCSVVLCISSIYLFEYNIIRYCLIVLLLTCCILYYRKIKA